MQRACSGCNTIYNKSTDITRLGKCRLWSLEKLLSSQAAQLKILDEVETEVIKYRKQSGSRALKPSETGILAEEDFAHVPVGARDCTP